MNTPTQDPAGPLPLRGLRRAALALQAAVASMILMLCLVGSVPPVRAHVFSLMGYGSHNGAWFWALGLGLMFVLLAGTVFLASLCLQARHWWRIAAGCAVLALVLAYLAHDEPVYRHPITMEEVSPAFPGSDASYAVLMRYGKEHPLGKAFQGPRFREPFPVFDPSRSDAWRSTLLSRRAEFEANWAALAPERLWWLELNSFDKLGDLTPARVDTEVFSFQVFRSISQVGVAVASLQALDGHGDQAIDTLIPILEVGHKLQPYSRALVRQMIGVVIEHLSLSTASFILDNARTSRAARLRLEAALQAAAAEAGARHLFQTEYALGVASFGDSRVGDILKRMGPDGEQSRLRRVLNRLTPVLNAFSPLLYNPHATFNRIGDLYTDWQEDAAKRQLDQLDERWTAFYADMARPGPKNIFGKWIGIEMTPAYKKVSENYWRNQDQRSALLARLQRR